MQVRTVCLHAEVGKVTLKSNGDEALSDEFLLKRNGDEAFNAQKKCKNSSNEAFNASLPRFIASSLHRCQHYINPCRNCHKMGKTFQHICKGNDDDVFRLCYGNYGNNEFVLEIASGFIASSLL
jgi:hypothetical protein